MTALPYYLAIGMPYELYWDGEPRLTVSYRQAHELRTQIKNQEEWMQGLYNYHGVRAVAEAIAFGIGGRKGNKPKEYPPEPFPLTEAEQRLALNKNKQRTLAWVEQGQH